MNCPRCDSVLRLVMIDEDDFAVCDHCKHSFIVNEPRPVGGEWVGLLGACALLILVGCVILAGLVLG